MDKVYVTREFNFEAAHHLPDYEGKCGKKHGHSYRLQVTVSGDICSESFSDSESDDVSVYDAMVIDFGELKNIVKNTVLYDHDHCDLNNIYTFPSAEVMVVCIFNRIKKGLAERTSTVTLENVKLWETSNCYAEYRREIS